MKEGKFFVYALKSRAFIFCNMNTRDLKVSKIAYAKLPSEYGLFQVISYQDHKDKGAEHLALVMGEVAALTEPVLVRIHSRCLTGDVFGSRRCDCRQQLVYSLKKISKAGQGVIIYLDQEGRGIGLQNKIRAYALQDQGLDTVAANVHLGFAPDERDYRVAAEILKDLRICNIELLTNNPEKIKVLSAAGITISKRTSVEVKPNKQNLKYLLTKKSRLNHMLCLLE